MAKSKKKTLATRRKAAVKKTDITAHKKSIDKTSSLVGRVVPSFALPCTGEKWISPADWKGKKVVGADIVKKVELIPYIKGFSTTQIIKKIKKHG